MEKVVAVHDGKFHADEVFAVAILKRIYPKLKIVRTRDEAVLKKANFRVDIGRKYNPKTDDFDHHQESFKLKRKNEIPYSSCGLVWKHFGRKLVNSDEAFDYIDEKLIQFIDAEDSGVKTFETKKTFIYTIGEVISCFNPIWKESPNYDSQFLKATEVTGKILDREIVKANSIKQERKIIKDALKKSDGDFIILEKRGISWQDYIVGKTKIKFVISFSGDRWISIAVPEKIGGFEREILFPKIWRGHDEELEKISGVKGALFCHKDGFVASAKTKEAIIKLTEIALKNKEK